MPTDTVYGFAAALDRPEALARLFTMKQRSDAKAIPVLLSSAAMVEVVATALAPGAISLMHRFWPGALTIVTDAREGLPAEVTSRDARGALTVALRVPDSPDALAIIAAAGGALAVTSANISGDAPALIASDIPASGSAAPDLIVDGGRVPGGVPSTIVRMSPKGMDILREGAIPVTRIASVLESRIGSIQPESPGAV